MHRTGHILLIHHSERQRMARVADWFGAGLATEDKLFYVDVAGWGIEVLAADMAARGFAVERALERKHLEFVRLEDLLTAGACEAVVEGTRSFRDRGGVVRCGSPAGERGWLLRNIVARDEQRLQVI